MGISKSLFVSQQPAQIIIFRAVDLTASYERCYYSSVLQCICVFTQDRFSFVHAWTEARSYTLTPCVGSPLAFRTVIRPFPSSHVWQYNSHSQLIFAQTHLCHFLCFLCFSSQAVSVCHRYVVMHGQNAVLTAQLQRCTYPCCIRVHSITDGKTIDLQLIYR